MGGGRAAGRVRVLVPAGSAVPDGVVVLDDDEAHHLRVRRAAAAERVELRDGAGLTGTGFLEGDPSRWAVRVESAARSLPAAPLVLAVAAGDRDRFAWLVEKAAELGATAVVPVETERTAGVASRVQAKHVEKLSRRALESIKQSGAAWALEVREPLPLAQLLHQGAEGARWIADAGGAAPPASVEGGVTVLVGPEGGFTAAERAAAAEAGWLPVRLGAHVLRFETAAIAAAACVAAARERTSP